MDERDEWCFEFVVTAAEPIPRAEADGLLTEAVDWAEGHRLGVGGGYRPASAEAGGAAASWAFRFGLCATGDRQLISRSSAADLWERLAAACRRRGFACAGGFRAFTPEESGGEP